MKITEILSNKTPGKLFRLYTMTFFMSMHFFGSVLIPFFTDWGGISKFEIFLLQSWFALWVFLLEVPTGVIADVIGRKYSLILATISAVCATLLYSNVPRLEIFLIGEFLFAMAVAFQSGADEALLYDMLKEDGIEHERAKVFGRMQACNLFGLLVAAPLGSVIAAKFGLNFPMMFTAVPFTIGAVIAWTIPEPKLHRSSESKRYLDVARKGIVYLTQNKTLRNIALDGVLVSVAGFYVFWFYQPILQGIGTPILQFGVFHMILMLSEILISVNFERLEKLFGSTKAYLRFSSLATASGFILVALVPNIITVILFLLLSGGLGQTRLKLMTAHMNPYIPSSERATILSFTNMLRRSINIVLNPFIGFMMDKSLLIPLFIVGLLPLSMAFFSPIRQAMFAREKDL